MYNSSSLQEKWQPVLEHTDLPEIKDPYRKAVTAIILENQEKALKEDAAFLGEAHANATGSAIANWDPILISLVRRSMPNLIAYDICGVQPMTGPTGLIFAMKSRFTSQSGTEALFNEADSDFSGTGTQTGTNPAVLNDTSTQYTTGITAEQYRVLPLPRAFFRCDGGSYPDPNNPNATQNGHIRAHPVPAYRYHRRSAVLRLSPLP